MKKNSITELMSKLNITSKKENLLEKKVRINFNFDEIKELYKKEGMICPSEEFLCWLIGFVEGDGTFVVSIRKKSLQKELMFAITQDDKDIQILNYIVENLGIGRVMKQGPTTSRFIIQSKGELKFIIAIFNGNLVLPKRKEQFKKFLEVYNEKLVNFPNRGIKLGTPQKYIESFILPTLEDSWLLGFTDSEGCFHLSFYKKNKKFNTIIYFSINQKGEENKIILEEIKKLFSIGNVYIRGPLKNNFCYIGTGIINLKLIWPYFDKFQLKTKKWKSFLLWKELHKRILNKEHLDIVKYEEIKLLASTINKNKEIYEGHLQNEDSPER